VRSDHYRYEEGADYTRTALPRLLGEQLLASTERLKIVKNKYRCARQSLMSLVRVKAVGTMSPEDWRRAWYS